MERFSDLLGAIKRPEEPTFPNLSLAFGNVLLNQISFARKIVGDRDQLGNRHASSVDDNLFTGLDSQKQPRQFGLDLIDVDLNHDSRC